MHLQFLGAATTVTGSQYLLTTERATILIDCGMFQGSPNESIRNRIPLAYDPKAIDAILLTHAHLDHCGLIPHVVKSGFTGPIWATKGTVELATLVLLDSGKLQDEFSKREIRREKRDPAKAAMFEKRDRDALASAEELAADGTDGTLTPADAAAALAATAGESNDDGGRPPVAIPVGERRAYDDPRQDPAHFGEPAIRRRVARPGRTQEAVGVPRIRSASRLRSVPRVPRARRLHRRSRRRRSSRRRSPAIPSRPSSSSRRSSTSSSTSRCTTPGRPGLARVASGRSTTTTEIEVAPGIHATYVDAGHILGSAIIRLRVADREGGPELRLVFSGDLGRPGTPILRDPTVVTDADYVLIESTYGGREHEPEAESNQLLAEAVTLVADHNGVLLVPSFAIGRTQEIVWQLDRLIEAGKIPLLPLYLDSPMASKASDVYRRHPEYYDAETTAAAGSRRRAARLPEADDHERRQAVEAIDQAPRPYMIVASNGMLTGGRVVGHLRNLIDDPMAVILFVGYQGVGTLGAHLQAGAKTIQLDGQDRQVRCQVRSISGFSAHADESELLSWIGNFAKGRKPGDPGLPKTRVHRPRRPRRAARPRAEDPGAWASPPTSRAGTRSSSSSSRHRRSRESGLAELADR